MIRYKKDKDNIVTLTLNMEGRNLNIINHEVSKSIEPILKHLEEEKAKRKLKGIIITSAKKNFLVGGDLGYLYHSKDAATIFELSQNLQKLYRQLERPGVPVVAAINGTALGNGFGLALACHHRIVIDRPSIRLGHPEVKLGLMPGGGEVIRLMWLLGVEKAFHVLNDGHRFSPKEALRIGIVSALAKDEDDLIDKAKKDATKAKLRKKVRSGTASVRRSDVLSALLLAEWCPESRATYPTSLRCAPKKCKPSTLFWPQ